MPSPTRYQLALQPPPLGARSLLGFTCSPLDLPQLARWLSALGFVERPPGHVREYGRWRSSDGSGLLVVWRSGRIVCQGKRPAVLASLLRAHVSDAAQLPLFDFYQVERN